MHELLHRRRNGRTGCREQTPVFDAYGALQQTIDCALIEIITQAKQERGFFAHTAKIKVAAAAHPQRIAKHPTLHHVAMGYLLLHTGIDLLPETGHGTHGRRPRLPDGLLDVGRMQIDTNRSPPAQAQVSPRLLEDVSQGKEVHHHIFLRGHRQTQIMDTKRFRIAGMMKHDALRLPRRARRVEDVGQVFLIHSLHPPLQLGSHGRLCAQTKKLVEVKGSVVMRMMDDLTVEDNNALQGRTRLCHPASDIILILLTDKKETDTSITKDILDLLARAGGIKRHGDGTHRISGKVHI